MHAHTHTHILHMHARIHMYMHPYILTCKHAQAHTYCCPIEVHQGSSLILYDFVFQIPVFAEFRKWKAFSVWKHNVETKRFMTRRKALADGLFLTNAVSE